MEVVVSPEEQMRLLRRFEPVIRYTAGELFLPMAVQDYVANCALVEGTGQRRVVRAEPGTLTLDELAALGRRTAGGGLSLEQVATPLDRRQYRAWRRRPDRVPFAASSRFAAVGLLARLVDAVFRVTLLLRGRVPGGFTAAAQQLYAGTPGYQRPVYYGRVVQDAGYVVLQYWYFYAMNDWRSTFGGVNDHEADWEQVTIFLVEEDQDVRPAWVAFSSHDEVGDDLRRRWDDPDITKVGEHPVVYAGAGSHSGAYLPGEYVVTTPIPLPAWTRPIRSFWRAIRPWAHGGEVSLLSVPYIDYRRGDGLGVGPGGELSWTAVAIDDDTPWVRDYRGLWGLDTTDPLGGERAPAGPRYERSHAVRQSWGQPVAWAGLDKEPPTQREALRRVEASRERLDQELRETRAQLASQRDRLRGGRSAEHAAGMPPRNPGQRVAALEADVAALRTREAELAGLLEGMGRALDQPAAPAPVHAHLSHRAMPLQARGGGRLIRFWSAASASILLAALGILLLVDGTAHVSIIEVLAAMLIVEALLRRRLVSLLAGLLLLAAAIVGVRDILGFLTSHAIDALGLALLLGAAALGVITAREALTRR
jgi:hypothetical protein